MSAAASAAGSAGPGGSLDRYHVVAPLGEGGMGRVELARSPAGRLVALKTLHPRLAGDARFRERFRREVAAARAVDDVFTAAVLDADTEAELPWLVSEFCAGPSLVDVISTLGPLDSEALGTLGAALAEALAAVHAAGLVHRDLKPANVVVTHEGPKILDFGLAKGAADEAGEPLTGTGDLVGTLGFIAPEQLSRDGRVGPAADVFAFGALLVLSSTGRNPYGSGTVPQVLHRTLNEPPDLLGVPDGEWAGFLRGCLSLAPADRPTVAQALEWCAGRAAARPWWEEEPVAGLVREHEEATAELVAAEEEWEDEIPTAFLAPPAPHAPREPRTPPGPSEATPVAPLDVPPKPLPTPRPDPHSPPRRRRFLAWAGAAVTAVSGSTTAAVLLLDDSVHPPDPRPSVRKWTSGRTLWSLDLDSSPQYGGEVLRHGDALYVRTAERLVCLNAASGEARWEYEGKNVQGVRPMGDAVYVLAEPDDGPGIVALDAKSGARRWTTRRLGMSPFRPFVPGAPASEGEGRSAQLSADSSVVCLVTYAAANTLWEQRTAQGRRWRAYGFDPRDGKPLWHRAGTATGVSTVHQRGGRLAVATSEHAVSLRAPADGPLVVLRDRDGTPEREIPGGSAHPEAHPGSSGVRHYPGPEAVAAVDLATGERRWSRPAGSEAAITPTATNGLVHTGTWGDLRALDAATGHQLWIRTDVRRLDDDNATPPLVSDGLLYASGSDPSLPADPDRRSTGWGVHALDARTGKLAWAVPVPRLSRVRTAAGGGLLHLCVDRTLMTLRGPGAA
ncbi:PQQ-binding-like beta-propeller repeat protein [Streptomyces sp. NBC_00237]|uniref:protein kinase domain-containing protein n=1 Tax=Streptomyces sp. NBC_00237 TaxID=2975687 RepID=UPI002258A89F|nr:PQQ-binding-like beta-propeller repeat protein [Streptomyces sp. NBC_00237]MCX5201997.1 PQQ-binding-like beta-propeller repeat protein [Streptomyces sp. NBC_00237]